jgi:O-methyltransferase
MIQFLNRFLKLFGLKLIEPAKPVIPIDASQDFIDTYYKTKPYTMTSLDRMFAAYNAAEYIEKNNIEGDIVECGVWRGGSAMIMAMKLMQMKSTSRNIFLYDTYEGMTDPTDKDVDHSGKHSSERLKKEDKKKGANIWCYATLDEVKQNMKGTGYPEEKIKYIKGKVEDTIPVLVPNKIALLRLDTDWYESTKHELIHLFPLLSKYGILIIDDYGHWRGSRQAVDEYFKELGIFPFLNRIDYSGRLFIKL